MRTLIALSLVLFPCFVSGGTNPAESVAPEAVILAQSVDAADSVAYANRLGRLIKEVDTANFESLYNAQQDGMALVHAVFILGTRAQQQQVLVSIDALIGSLPTAGSLADRSVISKHIATIELLAPLFTRARQRLFNLAFAIDAVPLPRSGNGKLRRVFPMSSGKEINVLSEVELQFCHLLSTVLRVAIENPIPKDHAFASQRAEILDRLARFLVTDKLRFYWMEVPAWHWVGPFANMRERVLAKLSPVQPEIRTPPWFYAVLDHELHLFAVAADFKAALRAGLQYRLTADEDAMLDDILSVLVRVIGEHVSFDTGSSGGFLVDYGLWSTNPSVSYAGCSASKPVPVSPCPLKSTATDSSHARRWPWWLVSYMRAWPQGSVEYKMFADARIALARQFAQKVLYFDSGNRPLLRNYMDGVDGWYRLREDASHNWGHGPSSMSGSMRYGSWATLARLEPKINEASVRMCEIFGSSEEGAIRFRTLYYGSASQRPEMAGLGEEDLYGADSLYALVCRISNRLGLIGAIER